MMGEMFKCLLQAFVNHQLVPERYNFIHIEAEREREREREREEGGKRGVGRVGRGRQRFRSLVYRSGTETSMVFC